MVRCAVIEKRDGWWWPKHDRECWAAIHATSDLDAVLGYVKAFDVCVQAGGNCGVWAKLLAAKFREVWTVEADLLNYVCLLRNVEGKGNIRPIFGALREASGKTVGWNRLVNIGGCHVLENSRYSVSTIAIDDLYLDACDLIILDIEGSEPFALEGAWETVNKFKPIIMVEDRGLKGAAKDWSHNFPGYKPLNIRTHRDTILIPC
jgi:FkbM family methyltransferase